MKFTSGDYGITNRRPLGRNKALQAHVGLLRLALERYLRDRLETVISFGSPKTRVSELFSQRFLMFLGGQFVPESEAARSDWEHDSDRVLPAIIAEWGLTMYFTTPSTDATPL